MTLPFSMLAVLIAATLDGSTITALEQAQIGRCSFKGSRPSSGSLVRGNVEIIGNVQESARRGNVIVWTGNGDVWVIYKSASEVGRHEFRVSGSVQTCNAF